MADFRGIASPAGSITSSFVVQSTIALLAIGFLTLLGIVGMTIWLGERARVYFDDVIDARDVRTSAVELRNAVQTAESSQRGYIFTGNEIYLAPYGNAKALARRQLAVLANAQGRYADTGLIQRLTVVVAEKFREMDDTITHKSARNEAELLAIVRTNRGKALMDEANVFLSGVIRAADERLTLGVGEQRANAARLRWVSIIGGVMIVLVVGGAAVTVIRYTREVVRARDEVRALNASLEDRVAERTVDLARANDEVQRFAHIVTHDLRAPLVNIMGFTSELESSVDSLRALIEKSKAAIDPADPVAEQARIAATVDVPEAIEFIRSSTRKMDTLINAILKLSREGRRQMQPERIDLRRIIEAGAAAVRHQLVEANGEIVLRLEAAVVFADRLALEQVLGNLLDNAIKYRSEGRSLRIEVRTSLASANRIHLDVADNGRGIAERDLERVFELFRRAGVQDKPGEGIGLAHVRTLVRALGGDVAVSSTLGEGTMFRVVLPHDAKALEGSPA